MLRNKTSNYLDNYASSTMKLVIAFVVFFFISIPMSAQTFQCTDIQFQRTFPNQKEVQKALLGSKGVLTFYDNAIKAELTDNYNSTVTFIFDKIVRESRKATWGVIVEYVYIDPSKNKYMLEYSTVLGYVTSFTIKIHYGNEHVGTAKFKRK